MGVGRLMGISRSAQDHARSLEALCLPEGLRSIRENPNQINLIIKEPIYEKMGWAGQIECPDLFLGYYNHDWTVVELKHSTKKKEKAYSQIESGKKMLVDVFGIPLNHITGKLVLYGGPTFYYEVV